MGFYVNHCRFSWCYAPREKFRKYQAFQLCIMGCNIHLFLELGNRMPQGVLLEGGIRVLHNPSAK